MNINWTPEYDITSMGNDSNVLNNKKVFMERTQYYQSPCYISPLTPSSVKKEEFLSENENFPMEWKKILN